MKAIFSWSRLRVVALAVAAVAVLLLSPVVRAQPPIPHPVEGREQCLICHEEGVARAPQVPADHVGRTNEMCQGCHLLSSPAAPEATPTLTPPQVTPAPATPEAPLLPKEANACFQCHRALGGRNEAITKEWEESIHAQRQIGCASCHGGDPGTYEMAVAMSPEAGFIGVPPRSMIPEICGSCHADVSLMRQYALPTDQLAKYRESQHGRLLAQGDIHVATCYDCHGGHRILRADNPASSVYATKVPETCARCHSSEALMTTYGIPTNQYELFRQSVHGVALLERQDRRAPNCAVCHGTHGATPPGFAEVAHVCGNCHMATQDYYARSVHAALGARGPKCVTCHGNHDVVPPTEKIFVGSEPRQCGSCHGEGSYARAIVDSFYGELSGAAMAIEEAEQAVARAEANRMIVVREKEQIIEARTFLTEARALQHSLELTTVKEKLDSARAIAGEVHQAAEQDISEATFRRQAMIVAGVFILLTIVALWMVKREIDRRRRAP